MTPDLEFIILIVALLLAAVLTGSAFYAAGQRYHAQQELDELDARQSRKDAAEVYRTMQITIRELSERLNAVEDAGTLARARIRELETGMGQLTGQLTEALAGIDILLAQLQRAEIDPEWLPKNTVIAAVPVNLSVLTDRIYQRFSDDELSDLARRIGIGPDDIPGETLRRRVTELVEMAQRRGLTGHLITVCTELRPRAKW